MGVKKIDHVYFDIQHAHKILKQIQQHIGEKEQVA